MPVGIFPEGASPYECLDLVGNVWEWTRSLWGSWENDRAKLHFTYPYDQEDEREDLSASDNWLRVLRGGSFSSNRTSARCACRHGGNPHDGLRRNGFRVVISHA